MTLNSLDVQNKTFNPQFRGFNKHEVDEFLDIVVRDYDEFAQTIKDQERELKSLRERVKYFDDMKDSLNKSIVVAQDAADNLRSQSQNEANNIIADAGNKSQLIIEAAKKEAGLILNAASEDARRLVRDTDDLKRKMRLYHQRMTSIIEAQLASVQSDDWAEMLQPTQSYVTNPEEKLQEILEEHLGDAENTLTKTQSITPLSDEDLKVESSDVKPEEIPEFSEIEEAPTVDIDELTETEEVSSEFTEESVNEDSMSETVEADEIFPELEAEIPEVPNPLDDQETIDLSELKN
ncbi:MAG: DivIVA domain-containing protein [Streptococcaceae bacterium]|nr:DivIVA domain-containing protein [Streptococcaceae bacterium]